MLDFMWVMAGPVVTRVLADYGATVIRVESPSRPGAGRSMAPFRGGEFAPQNSLFFDNMNAGKLGLALNLSCEEGREVARDLVRWADVVGESFAPGAFGRWGARLRLPPRHQAGPHHDEQLPLRSGRPPLRCLRLWHDGRGHRHLHRADRLPRSPAGWSLQRLHRYRRAALCPARPAGGPRPPSPHGRGPVHRPLSDREFHPLHQPLPARLPAHWPRAGPDRQPRPRHGPPRRLPRRGDDDWIAIAVRATATGPASAPLSNAPILPATIATPPSPGASPCRTSWTPPSRPGPSPAPPPRPRASSRRRVSPPTPSSAQAAPLATRSSSIAATSSACPTPSTRSRWLRAPASDFPALQRGSASLPLSASTRNRCSRTSSVTTMTASPSLPPPAPSTSAVRSTLSPPLR